MLADFLASSWPVILAFATTAAIGYMLGRVRPIHSRRTLNLFLRSADDLGRRGRIQPTKPWPRS